MATHEWSGTMDLKSKILFFVFVFALGCATYLSYDKHIVRIDYPLVEESAENISTE